MVPRARLCLGQFQSTSDFKSKDQLARSKRCRPVTSLSISGNHLLVLGHQFFQFYGEVAVDEALERGPKLWPPVQESAEVTERPAQVAGTLCENGAYRRWRTRQC